MKSLARGLVLSFLLTLGLVQAQEQERFTVGGLTFEVPEHWTSIKPSSTMRKAQLQVPGKRQNGEVVFFHFGPGNAGGTEANIERWYGQFQEPKSQINPRSEKAELADGTRVTLVQAEGTYLSGLPGRGARNPQPDFALYGAILEHSKGHVFVRFTAPKATVIGYARNFRDMILSARGETVTN